MYMAAKAERRCSIAKGRSLLLNDMYKNEMEVLEVKAPSKAERRVIYYSCECRVHALRFEAASVLPFCLWHRVSRMKRLWDVIVGNSFLRPQLWDDCRVSRGMHQAFASLWCVSL